MTLVLREWRPLSFSELPLIIVGRVAKSLFRILPKPGHISTISEYGDSDEEQMDEPLVSALTLKASLPTYGKRRGWQPMSHDEFGDGGAYPECHVAQYPLEMGRKKACRPIGSNVHEYFNAAFTGFFREHARLAS